jgi:hypothetical protein
MAGVAMTDDQQPGWRVLLSHLNVSRPDVRLLADFLQVAQPDLDPRRAKRLAEKARKGQAIRREDLGQIDGPTVAELLAHLDAIRRSYAAGQSELEAGRRETDRLRQTIPGHERERLKTLRELGNGKALTPSDYTLAALRTPEAIRAWAGMSRRAKLAWFARVEADLLARDKKRSPDDPPLITSTYRRMYLSARREVANETDYEVLGVDLDADEATIKKAYRQAAMQHHPDMQGDTKAFQRIHAAYQRLIAET